MASFVYKTVKTTSMKIAGVIDTDRMIIEVDGEEKKLSTLLQEFNNYEIEFNIKTKMRKNWRSQSIPKITSKGGVFNCIILKKN